MNVPNLPSEGQFGISLPEGFVPDEPETDAGEFDYQRKADVGGKDGFVQLRPFGNVSNPPVRERLQLQCRPVHAAGGGSSRH